MRRFAPLVVGSGCVLSACVAEIPPTTLEIRDVLPREIDVGDRLEILGGGFPVQRTASIVLRGRVHRPGMPPEAVSVAMEIESRSEGRLDLPFGSALAGRLIGDATPHGTFRGDVTVTFPPAESGTAPLAGKATGIVLDVHGTASAVSAHRDEAGRRALDFLGIELAMGAPASGGLTVANVRDGSRAARAGIAQGDVLVEVDGVQIDAIADVVPSGDVAAVFVVRRGDVPKPRNVVVPLDGWTPSIPRPLAGSALAIGTALALLVFATRKPGSTSAFLERRIAARTASAPRRVIDRLRAGTKALLDGDTYGGAPGSGSTSLAGGGGATAGLVVTSAACAALAMAPPAWLEVCDVAVLSTVGLTLGVATALFANARTSFRAGLDAATDAVRAQLPAAAAIVVAVGTAGSLRVQDALRVQGSAPWDWLAFRTPFTLAAFVAWLAAAAIPGASLSTRRRDEGAGTAELVVAHAAGFLAAALYLGGPRVPFVRAVDQEASLALQVVAAIVFASKAALVVMAITGIRALVPREARARRGVLVVAVAALAASSAWWALAPSTSLSRFVSLSTFAIAIAFVGWIGLRILAALDRVRTRHLDPRV